MYSQDVTLDEIADTLGYEDVYFADTDDAHTVAGELAAYAGPTESEIRSAWARLTDQQRFVLGRRRGLNGDGHSYTHREIADVMGVSHVAVIGIEQRALRSLEARIGFNTELLAAA